MVTTDPEPQRSGDYSEIAPQFRRYRPKYPSNLYEFVLQHVKHTALAWDCGTGTGQVASSLALHFGEVVATDLSSAQIENAEPASNIRYVVGRVEESNIEAGTIDLISSAQAVHWFNLDQFYREAVRVGKEGATIALWGYGRCTVDRCIDEILEGFHRNYLDRYWDDAPRVLLANEYRTLPFPFEEIRTPRFAIAAEWTPDELEGYLRTTSSVQEYIRGTGNAETDPIPELMLEVKHEWRADEVRSLTFPVFMRLGVIHG